MSESKKEPQSDDLDWADALDEWEQKAFSSISPPALTEKASVAPPAPEPAAPIPAAPFVSPSARPSAPPGPEPFAFSPSAPRVSASTRPAAPSAPPPPGPAAHDEPDDRTMASSQEPVIETRPSTRPHAVEIVDSTDFARKGATTSVPAISVREVEVDDLEIADAAPVTPGPAPEASAPRAPIAGPPRAAPSIRFQDSGRSATAPPVSAVTGALQAVAKLSSAHEESGQPSRMPMPSVREVGSDVAALLEEQATWLEAEAATAAASVQARVFLALSEVRAILGDRPAAQRSAERARDVAPQRVFGHVQVRAVRGPTSDAGSAEDEVAALATEEACATLPAARHHAGLLAAEALRRSGDADGALQKLSQLAEEGDIRAVAGRVALGLAAGDTAGLSAAMGAAAAAPVAEGLAAALRLRGLAVGAPGTVGSANGISDVLRASQKALEAGDAVAAGSQIATMRAVPELAGGAAWLASALVATSDAGRSEALTLLEELARGGDPRASRVLAARAVEADDAGPARAALGLGGFSAGDEVALTALLDLDTRPDLDALTPEMAPLGAAVAAVDTVTELSDVEEQASRAAARAARVVGSDRSRAATRMARLLTAGASTEKLEAGVEALRASSPDLAGALDLELALRAGAYSRVSELLRGWRSVAESQGRVVDAALAAGLVAERAGDPAQAIAAYREARRLDRTSEVALRAMAALSTSTDLPGDLNELADDLGGTVQGALARLEAVIREDSVDDATRTDLLERAHHAAPALPFASYLAERIALRSGNADDAIRWIEERRTAGADPTELIIDAVREATILARRDPDATSGRLAEAHRQRPVDVALRELYEQTLAAPPDDRAQYWEAQASRTVGDSRTLLAVEVAHAYERVGDTAGTMRVAEPLGDAVPLLRLARDRGALEGGEAAALVDQLLGEAKYATDQVARREAYERLADIDGLGRGDTTSALLWHKAIVEEDASYLPSLRYVEQALLRDGRDEELEPTATALAHALARPGSTDGGECVAHADLAARLRARGAEGDWESTFEIAALAARDAVPSLSSLRLLHAHARVRKDDALLISISEQLLDRATRPVEMAALRLRLAEAAFRQGNLEVALSSLERSTTEDPGDLVAFRLLAEVRRASGDAFGAAEAHEAVARLSLVPRHRLDAWYDAASLWLTSTERSDQAMHALEQSAAIDLSHEDVFARLSGLYASKGQHADLASLLERRVAIAADPDERVTLEVERGRALLASGDRAAARVAVAAALQERPDHTTALATFGELSALDEDWPAAEDAWVRLARLLATPDEQREIYERLGDLYSTKSVHLERAELAFKEVLKRAPEDLRTLERLIDVYRRQRDVSRAVEGQQELIGKAKTPAEKSQRTIELAALYEDPGHDDRKAEQVLDGARREFPTDVGVLRAMAEFYVRHKQTPAMNILLDRAAADARRAFAAGRFAPALFEIMRAVYALRGDDDAARTVGASLLAIEGEHAEVRGAFGQGLDPRVDDLLAPDVLSSGLRTLLARRGSMLDVAAPIDLRALAAQPAGPDARRIVDLASSFAEGLGLAPPKIYVSRTVGRTCLPAASEPPSLVIGEALLSATNDRAVEFLVMRAMKLVAVKASSLVRTTSTDLAVLVPAWLQAIVPSWTPQGVNPTALAAAARKVAQSAPPPMSEELVSLGLEVASQLGTRASTLGGLAMAWANRAALLGVGDPNAALEAIAWSLGNKDGAPADPAARTAWIGRTHEAKDLLIFSVGDGYGEARARLELRH